MIKDFIQEAADKMAFWSREYSAPGGSEGPAGDDRAAALSDAAARFWYGWRALHPVASEEERNRHWLGLAIDGLGEAVRLVREQEARPFNPFLPRPPEDLEALRVARHEAARAALVLLAEFPGPRQLAWAI